MCVCGGGWGGRADVDLLSLPASEWIPSWSITHSLCALLCWRHSIPWASESPPFKMFNDQCLSDRHMFGSTDWFLYTIITTICALLLLLLYFIVLHCKPCLSFHIKKIQYKVNFLRQSLVHPVVNWKNMEDGDYYERIMCLPSAAAATSVWKRHLILGKVSASCLW